GAGRLRDHGRGPRAPDAAAQSAQPALPAHPAGPHGPPAPAPPRRRCGAADSERPRRRSMSGAGAPADEPFDGSDLSVGVVASRWDTHVMDGLLDGTRRALAAYSVTDVTEVRVPGTFELPL